MIKMGIAGLGFMGMTHFVAAKHVPGLAVTAIATRDPVKRAGDWSGIQGNMGPRGDKATDLTGVTPYASLEEMLADPELEVIDVCLPTDQHLKGVIQCLEAGKHVFVEKPLAIDSKSARKMVDAALKAGKTLLVGHVLPFFPEFAFAAEAVQSGKYGRLLSGHFRRIISPPSWSSDMSELERMGGPGVDLHIHDNHLIRLLFGMPETVSSIGHLNSGTLQQVHTLYHYPQGGPTVSCVSGGISASGMAFGHGFEIFFEQATLQFDAGTYAGEWVVNRPLSVIDQAGKVHFPELEAGARWSAPFEAELKVMVDAIAHGKKSGALEADYALQALYLCEAELESVKTGKTVKLPAAEHFT
jgi:predicted dehydrogenase